MGDIFVDANRLVLLTVILAVSVGIRIRTTAEGADDVVALIGIPQLALLSIRIVIRTLIHIYASFRGYWYLLAHLCSDLASNHTLNVFDCVICYIQECLLICILGRLAALGPQILERTGIVAISTHVYIQ